MQEEDRVETGITGLDELIEGGLPRGFTYTILGGPGAGKTLFGCQFIFKGATVYGENGIYVTFEEPPFSIFNNMLRFNWNLYDLETRSKLAFVDASPIRCETPPGMYLMKGGPIGEEKFDMDGLIGVISEAKKKVAATRCVIDTISALTLQYKDDFELRQKLLTLIKALTEMRLTTILLSETSEERLDYQRFGVESFLAQGIIILHMLRVGELYINALQVKKIRGVKHSKKLCVYKITPRGLEVYPQEPLFGVKV